MVYFVQDVQRAGHPLATFAEFKKCYLGCLLRQCKCVNRSVEHLVTVEGSIGNIGMQTS